jgi:hypothetical protein
LLIYNEKLFFLNSNNLAKMKLRKIIDNKQITENVQLISQNIILHLKCSLQDNKGYFEVKSDQFQQTVNNVSCNPNQTSTEDLRLIYVYHFENEGYRSPYNSKQTQLHPDTGIRGNFGTPNEGFSHITKSSDYKNLIITTSYKTGEQPLVSIIRDPRT